MGRELPTPNDLFSPEKRHFVMLAHFDDEIPMVGVIKRLSPETRFAWLTNSDGLYYESEHGPATYGEMRRQETLRAFEHLDIGQDRLTFLGHSELTFYRLFAEMVESPSADPAVPAFFDRAADEVLDLVAENEPDVIWTLAYQGGQPEHDLLHLYTMRAAREVGRRLGRTIPVYEVPAYELVVLLMRFRPWRKEPFHAIELSSEELLAKRAVVASYPTQERLLGRFERVLRGYGLVSRLFGRPKRPEDFARREVFALVAPGRNYARSTHVTSRLDYPLDDYLGTPIRFHRTLAPIARHFGLGC